MREKRTPDTRGRASTKARSKSNGSCGGTWKSRAREFTRDQECGKWCVPRLGKDADLTTAASTNGRSPLNRNCLGIEAQMRGRRLEDARSWIDGGRDTRSYCPDCRARCFARWEDRAGRHGPAPGIVQAWGWLRLGLASSSRALEPVERGMGSAALRATPLLRRAGVHMIAGEVPIGVGAITAVDGVIRNRGKVLRLD